MSLKFLVRPFLAAALATTVFSAPRALAEEAPPAAQKAAAPQIEVVFVLDTTGSMGSLLEGAKQKIFSIASRIATGKPTPRLKVGVVAYRDVGDEYVTKRFDLSEDLDTVFTHLRQLRADGGGDSPEHVGRGLGEAVSKMSWSSGRETMKVIFLVGDAPPASREKAWNFQQWSKAAKERRIVVNTVRCGSDGETEKAWKAVAKLTDGTFDSIDSSGGMLAVATPYDAELAEVNGKIAAKTLYTGTAAVQAENRGRAEQMAALPAESAAERISYMKKARGKGALGAGAVSSAPVAVGGAVDLVEKPEMLTSVKEAELPAPLQGLSKPEQAAKVKTLVAERKALEERAGKLAAERDTWRQKNVAETEASFDDNVMKSVRKQASSYGVAY